MRALPAAFVCCAALFSYTIADASAETEKATPELTVLSKENVRSNDGRPTVLRGSATRRGTVDASSGGTYEPIGFHIGAGEKLWLTDPVTGYVVVCDVRRTSRVGSRFVSCLEDELPFSIYDE